MLGSGKTELERLLLVQRHPSSRWPTNTHGWAFATLECELLERVRLRSPEEAVALLAIARGLYGLLSQRVRGSEDSQGRQILRDLIAMPADVDVTEPEVQVSFHRRHRHAHLPIIFASGMMDRTRRVRRRR